MQVVDRNADIFPFNRAMVMIIVGVQLIFRDLIVVHADAIRYRVGAIVRLYDFAVRNRDLDQAPVDGAFFVFSCQLRIDSGHQIGIQIIILIELGVKGLHLISNGFIRRSVLIVVSGGCQLIGEGNLLPIQEQRCPTAVRRLKLQIFFRLDNLIVPVIRLHDRRRIPLDGGVRNGERFDFSVFSGLREVNCIGNRIHNPGFSIDRRLRLGHLIISAKDIRAALIGNLLVAQRLI